MEHHDFQGITEPTLIAKLQLLCKDIVVDGIELNKEWIISHRWVAIPTESDLTARDAEWLSNACLAFNYDECFAIITEPDPINFACYRMPTTKTGFLNISYECSSNHFVLMPEDQGFAVLRPFGLYSVVAGSREFVEMAVGSTIETAREMFWDFASDTNWQESDRTFLTKLARKYQAIGGVLAE